MRKALQLLGMIAIFATSAFAPLPAAAQSNDDDYTPLNSRIKRERQFPTELFPKFDPSTWSNAQKDRSKELVSAFSGCIWRRSNEKALDMLAKTDLGFATFEQIGMDNAKAAKIFGFDDCLGRVASRQGMGMMLRWYPGGLRQWMLEEAYLDRFPTEPTWIKPGLIVEDRELPLSAGIPGVRDVLDFADCVILAAPYEADYFFRTSASSPAEKAAIAALVPSLGPCLPEGVQMKIDAASLRPWIGEGLWHAALNSRPPTAADLQETN